MAAALGTALASRARYLSHHMAHITLRNEGAEEAKIGLNCSKKEFWFKSVPTTVIAADGILHPGALSSLFPQLLDEGRMSS